MFPANIFAQERPGGSIPSPLPRRRQTPLDDLQQVLILQSGLHPLLIVQLLIHRVLGLVCAFFDPDVHAEAGRERAHEPNAQGKAFRG